MKRVILKGPKDLSLEKDEEPEPGPGEVLVRVRACGICGSDVHSYLGKHPFVIYPVTPGHEFSGEAVAVGPGSDDDILGAHVCIEPSLACGSCPQCLSGRYNICEKLRVMGFQAPGAMCETISVPRDRVHVLPSGVGFRAGALAEPAAVGVHALSRSGARPGNAILVVGAGVIGLMVIKAAKALGCRVFAVEAGSEFAQRALDFGADEAWAFGRDPSPAFRDVTRSGALDAVFECVGKAETVEAALELAPRGSTIVVVGVFSGPTPISLSLVQDGELEMKGTLMYMYEDFERAIELIAQGAIEADELITHTVGLDEVERGFALLTDPETITLKVLVELEGG